ncbi:hypothetical protein BJ165DRAFT_1532641 [Panaeolus papilionaceus]|nr:hypothetical protein BJ165DRAFT_1532641 [Panaeolus papilionaceus]
MPNFSLSTVPLSLSPVITQIEAVLDVHPISEVVTLSIPPSDLQRQIPSTHDIATPIVSRSVEEGVGAELQQPTLALRAPGRFARIVALMKCWGNAVANVSQLPYQPILLMFIAVPPDTLSARVELPSPHCLCHLRYWISQKLLCALSPHNQQHLLCREDESKERHGFVERGMSGSKYVWSSDTWTTHVGTCTSAPIFSTSPKR